MYFYVSGMHHQGIFRIPGSQVEINDLKNAFEKGLSILIIFVPDLEKLFLEAFAFLNYIDFVLFLAHRSRRLTGELIGYPWIRRPSSSVRPSSVVVRSHFQTSSPLKPLGQSKPNFMWSLLGKGERKFI